MQALKKRRWKSHKYSCQTVPPEGSVSRRCASISVAFDVWLKMHFHCIKNLMNATGAIGPRVGSLAQESC